jgi:glycerophosphoryl diester phosphodiesterase
VASFPYLDHPGPIAFAHRGGPRTGRPENTLVAFEAAVAMGYRYLETDAHATRDGVLIAFHDDRLDRVTDRAGVIEELPYREVKAARVGGIEPIPLLEDLLAAFPDARINVDCKKPSSLDALVAAVRRTQSIDRLCIGSFSSSTLRKVRSALGDRLCTSAGPEATVRWRLLSWAGPLASTAAACYQVPVRQQGLELVTAASVRRAHKAGKQVHVWTIDEPAEMDRLLDLGVDGIMTDDPAALKAVLQRRGQWV